MKRNAVAPASGDFVAYASVGSAAPASDDPFAPASGDSPSAPPDLAAFREMVWARGAEFYRDFPWRRSPRDPYAVLVSEVMLQQTQVARVMNYWQRWLDRYPTVDALAAASLSDVLASWQGLGYNRRAKALHRMAGIVSDGYGGVLPVEKDELLALPGIGPATAAGVRAFAAGIPDIYLETNVRAVFLHEFFPAQTGVPDKLIYPLVESTCDRRDPAGWYYALLDYGAWLKANIPNPSRASSTHSVQSAFQGSRRQKRAYLLRTVMMAGRVSTDDLVDALSDAEEDAGREPVSSETVISILADLAAEGFITRDEPSGSQEEETFWEIAG